MFLISMVMSAFLEVEGPEVASIFWSSYFLQDHLRAAATQSHLGNIHLLSISSWQHLLGGVLGQHLRQEGVLGLGTASGPSVVSSEPGSKASL